ncbi:MAG: B12-binding domain-containing radical SAM protein [bacterium JZ-2024 1]
MARVAFIGQVRTPESDVYADVTPIGTILLAQLARERGHEVRKIEIRIDLPRDWKRDLLEFQPEILCFTVFTNWYAFYADIFCQVRELLPDCTIVMGGPHVSGVQEWTLEDSPEVDFAVYGEGEKGFLGLLDYWAGKRSLAEVPNLIYRENGAIKKNCPAPELSPAELDTLPFPAYDLLPPFDFQSFFGRKAMVITSRGCYFRCKFCFPQFIGESVRSHSPEYIIRIIRMLYHDYGVRYVTIGDALFPPKRKWLDEFLDLLEQERFRDLKWAFTTRVKYIKREHYTRMKHLGLLIVPVGVEAASDEILKDTDKEITIADIKETLQMLREVHLPVLTNYIIGHRLDSPETIGRILPFLSETLPHLIQTSTQVPLPGTPLFDLVPPERKRYYLRPWDFPSINQRGFVKTKAEYDHIGANIRVHYYKSFRYLWHNCILWFLRNPADPDARQYASIAFWFWRTHLRKFVAGVLSRYHFGRTLVAGLRKIYYRAPASF